jgi:hypothetical protein
MLNIKSPIFFVALSSIIPILVYASTVTSIDFKSTPSNSEIDIQADGPISFQKSENSNDKQIVLDLNGATLAKNASRNLDTSSFDSKVLLVSPYSVGGDGGNSRVVIQLRDMVSANVAQSGNLLKITLPNSGSAASSDATSSSSSSPTSAAIASSSGSPVVAPAGSEDAPPVTSAGSQQKSEGVKIQGQTLESPTSVAAAASESAGDGTHLKDKLDQFIDARETRRFNGSPITLKVRDADVTDVFRLIAEASGFNT